MHVYGILLADAHRLMRKGIQRILEERPGLKVVGESGNGPELFTLMTQLSPDMVIIDIAMPDGRRDRKANTRKIKSLFPQVKLLVATLNGDRDYLAEAVTAGADGYICLLAEKADKELFLAIETIRRGERYLPPPVARAGRARRVDGKSVKNLTPRQAQVLRLVAEGRSSKEIAEHLHISFRTVENHRTGIMKRLGLRKNIDLVRYAIGQGYITALEE
jgi:DNA-binding NarL/FixJ family response regulator